MDIQRRYSYDPQWWLIGYIFAGCIIMMILTAFPWIFSLKIGVSLGGFLFLMTLLLTLRRLIFRRYLELGESALMLPTGFLRSRIVEIPYSAIERIWETRMLLADVLCLGVGKRTFEIRTSFLPDEGSYMAIRDFLGSSAQRNSSGAGVSEVKETEPLSEYGTSSSYFGDGEIYSFEEERVVWRFGNEPNVARYSYGIWRLPDFIIRGLDGGELLRIRRSRRFPWARFHLLVNGNPIGQIRSCGVLFTRYRLSVGDSPDWKFHLPHFTVNFRGICESGDTLRIKRIDHWNWYVGIQHGAASLPLLATIAFLHRERLRHG